MSQNWQQLKITVRFVSNHSQGQTDVTAFDINFNIVSKSWPIIFSGNKFSSLLNSIITG